MNQVNFFFCRHVRRYFDLRWRKILYQRHLWPTQGLYQHSCQMQGRQLRLHCWSLHRGCKGMHHNCEWYTLVWPVIFFNIFILSSKTLFSPERFFHRQKFLYFRSYEYFSDFFAESNFFLVMTTTSVPPKSVICWVAVWLPLSFAQPTLPSLAWTPRAILWPDADSLQTIQSA